MWRLSRTDSSSAYRRYVIPREANASRDTACVPQDTPEAKVLPADVPGVMGRFLKHSWHAKCTAFGMPLHRYGVV